MGLPKTGDTKVVENKEFLKKLALEQANKKLQSDYEAIQKQAARQSSKVEKLSAAVKEVKDKLKANEKENTWIM